MRNDNCKNKQIPSLQGRAATEEHFGLEFATGKASKSLFDVFRILSERNEAVFIKKDSHTTICGIPAASKPFYFESNAIPESAFFLGGWEYLVVYEISDIYDVEGGLLCN